MSIKIFNRRFNFRIVASVGLALVFVVAIALVMTTAVKVARGVSYTAATPQHVLRLEILNGCKGAGIAGKAAKLLSNYKDHQLEIIVVGTGDFEVRIVPRSFVIAREKDDTSARYLARLIGLDPAEVVYQPLENNYRQVSATLVLGEDYVAAMLPGISGKE